MEFDCPNCNSLLESKETLPFGEEIKCPSCKKTFVVEYDYTGEDCDSISFWLKECANYGDQAK